MKFSNLYEELTFDDVFPVASPEEVADRQNTMDAIRHDETIKACQRLIDKLKKAKLPDGTWHIFEDLNLCKLWHMPDTVSLTTLEPLNVSIVDGDFICKMQQLRSLKGGPVSVGHNYICSGNGLSDLIGAPIKVGGSFDCTDNFIISLEGAPKIVHGDFMCINNNTKFTVAQIKKKCDVNGEIYV